MSEHSGSDVKVRVDAGTCAHKAGTIRLSELAGTCVPVCGSEDTAAAEEKSLPTES